MECFTVYADEIEGRIDPLYLKNKTIIEEPKTRFALVKLGRLLKTKVQYGANEIAIDGKPRQDIRYIRITDIDEFGNLRSDEWKTARNIEKKYLLNEGDILFARSGATAGKCFLYKNEYGKSIFAGYLIRFIFDTSKVNPKYIFYYTQLERYKLWVKSIQRPSGQPNINSEEFKSFKIPLLPIQTQNRIAQLMGNAYEIKKQKETEAQQLIDTINDYVLEELSIKLPELKDKRCYAINAEEVKNKRIDTYYYQPKFREVEETLEKGKYDIDNLKKYITKIHYGVSIKNIYIDEGIPLLRILNLKPNKIDLTDVVKLDKSKRKEIGKGFVYEGDILISRSGSVGIVAVVPKEADGFAFGSFMIKFCVSDEINNNYVSIWLNNVVPRLFTEREKIGAIQGNITISTIENFKIPIPPLHIQQKIGEKVKARMQKAEQLKKEAETILKQAKAKVEAILLGEEKIEG